MKREEEKWKETLGKARRQWIWKQVLETSLVQGLGWLGVFLLLLPLFSHFSWSPWWPALTLGLVGLASWLAKIRRAISISDSQLSLFLDSLWKGKDLLPTVVYAEKASSEIPPGYKSVLAKRGREFLSENIEKKPLKVVFPLSLAYVLPLCILGASLSIAFPPSSPEGRKVGGELLLAPVEMSLGPGGQSEGEDKRGKGERTKRGEKGKKGRVDKETKAQLKKIMKEMKKEEKESKWLRNMESDPQLKKVLKVLGEKKDREEKGNQKLKKLLEDPEIRRRILRHLPRFLKKEAISQGTSKDLAARLEKIASQSSTSGVSKLRKEIEKMISSGQENGRGHQSQSPGREKGDWQQRGGKVEGASLIELTDELRHLGIPLHHWPAISRYFKLRRQVFGNEK